MQKHRLRSPVIECPVKLREVPYRAAPLCTVPLGVCMTCPDNMGMTDDFKIRCKVV